MAKKVTKISNPLYDDLMAGFQELSEYARRERELRVTTLQTPETPAVPMAPKMESGYLALFARGPHGWAATVPDLPGCVATGRTAEEAEANVRQEIARYIEAAQAEGETIPPPSALAKTLLVGT